MINLLPTNQKSEISYARRNTRLLKISSWLIISILIAATIIFAGNLYIIRSTNSYQSKVDESKKSLENEQLGDAQQRITDLTNNVTLIQKVIENNILLSKLLKKAGAAMPSGTVLLTLDITKIAGGIDLSAGAKDYQSATQIQVNLADPKNNVFEKADIVSIDCNGTSNLYPCTVNIRALFGDNSPYLFLNKDKEV